MRVFTCKDFTGHNPVGQGAVIVAEDETQARALLEMALLEEGLRAFGDETLVELNTQQPTALVLVNGEY